VDGFVRPFRLPAAQELLESRGGEKLGDGCFWMNGIKSHCYATFQTLEAAERAREALDGIQWPEMGGILSSDFAEQTAAEIAKGVVPIPSARSGAGATTAAIAFSSTATTTTGGFGGAAGELKRSGSLSARLGPPVDPLSGSGHSGLLHSDKEDSSFTRRKRELGPSPDRPSKATKLGDGGGRIAAAGGGSGGPGRGREVLNLDEIFRTTKVQPKLYWLPVVENKVSEKRSRREENLGRGLDAGGRPFHDPRGDDDGGSRGRDNNWRDGQGGDGSRHTQGGGGWRRRPVSSYY